MSTIAQRLEQLHRRIAAAEQDYHRPPGSVRLLAVSKTRPAEDILAARAAGQRCFGENYLQEASEKIRQIQDPQLEWHYIGRIQGNKTRLIAAQFHWVHGLDQLQHARRLNDQRPAGLPPLKICVQVNVDTEKTKGGVRPEEAAGLVEQLAQLPNLSLEGLMALPAWTERLEDQRRPFARLRQLRDQLASPELPLLTLSMGMSDDLEAAIAEGASIVRIGTALFGARIAED